MEEFLEYLNDLAEGDLEGMLKVNYLAAQTLATNIHKMQADTFEVPFKVGSTVYTIKVTSEKVVEQ